MKNKSHFSRKMGGSDPGSLTVFVQGTGETYRPKKSGRDNFLRIDFYQALYIFSALFIFNFFFALSSK